MIDLDPESSELGLLLKSKPDIDARRGLHTTTGGDAIASVYSGLTWYFANGWHSRSVQSRDIRDWTYKSVDVLRSVTQTFAERKSEKPTIALVLPGHSGDPKRPHFRLDKCVEVLDEALRGNARFLIAGEFVPSSTVTNENKLPIGCSVADLTRKLSEIFDAPSPTSPAMVPTADGGWAQIPSSRLVVLHESLDVLHSQILAHAETAEENEFWKGRPPSWNEIALGVDIDRLAAQKLESRIDEVLEAGVSRTILVSAVPGAGATTVMRRVAWNFREKFATVVITKASRWIGQNLTSLHSVSHGPIVVFAESSELSENAREDLYKELVQNGVRVVLVYFRRTFRRLGDSEGINDDGALSDLGLLTLPDSKTSQKSLTIPDPMPRKEAEVFLNSFRHNTDDEQRLQELHRITYDDALARYRSPFFYGLITFQREFLKVDEYVKHHLHLRSLGRKTKNTL